MIQPVWNHDQNRYTTPEVNAALAVSLQSRNRDDVVESVRLSYSSPSVAFSNKLGLWVVRDCFHQVFAFEHFPAEELEAECQEPGAIANSFGDDSYSTQKYYQRLSDIMLHFDQAEKQREELRARPRIKPANPGATNGLLSQDEIDNILKDLF